MSHFRLPSGFHDNSVKQLSSFILSTCPIHFHRLVFTLVLLSISWFDTMFGHLIFNIFRRHLNINMSSLRLSPSFIFQSSHPYNSTDLTSELNGLNLVFNGWMLGLNNCLSLMKDTIAFQILSQICSYPPNISGRRSPPGVSGWRSPPEGVYILWLVEHGFQTLFCFHLHHAESFCWDSMNHNEGSAARLPSLPLTSHLHPPKPPLPPSPYNSGQL